MGKVSNWNFNPPKCLWDFLQKLMLDLNSFILRKAYVYALWASTQYSHNLLLFVLKLKVKLGFPQLVSSFIFWSSQRESSGEILKAPQSCRCWWGGYEAAVLVWRWEVDDSCKHLGVPFRQLEMSFSFLSDLEMFCTLNTLFCLVSLKYLPSTLGSKWKCWRALQARFMDYCIWLCLVYRNL